ncbi:hypothetical protein V6N13_051115 [Hibiscus sabdariffa]|uniref:RNase H type-1 domain-containing protein n=1 Tax=Hibiscus sabdariffa TaxID=183260 RepID=A0ABR2T2L2_9ROSI
MIKLFLVSLWPIWSHRNKRVHENVSQSPTDLASYIVNYIHEFDATIDSQVSAPAHAPSTQYYSDFEGFILAASSVPHLHILTPKIAEAVACKQEMSLALELDFQKVIVEGDALSVIKKISVPSIDMLDTFALVSNIKETSKDFVALSFCHVNRRRNEAAHLLAREGRRFNFRRVWIEEAPKVVEVAVQKDCWWVDLRD